MKLAHISDIHLDTKQNPECIAEIDTLIARLLDRGHEHIVMTGDIVDVANLDDLERLAAVLDSHKIFTWEKTTLVPGNHDIFGKYEFKGDGMLQTATRAVGAIGSRYQEKLREFCDIMRPTITDAPVLPNYFPFVKVLEGGQNGIAIVSFNSVLEWSFSLNPTGSRGQISAAQLESMVESEVLDVLKGKFVIALSHHAYEIYEPQSSADKVFVWSMEMVGRESYLKTLQQIGATVALHGHFHRSVEYKVGGVHFINSGSVRRSGMKFNSLTINRDGSYTNQFLRV
jgi:3',5'-cyclic-AMP phosphodiesterase